MRKVGKYVDILYALSAKADNFAPKSATFQYKWCEWQWLDIAQIYRKQNKQGMSRFMRKVDFITCCNFWFLHLFDPNGIIMSIMTLFYQHLCMNLEVLNWWRSYPPECVCDGYSLT